MGMIRKFFSSLAALTAGCGKSLRDIMYGMTSYELVIELKKDRGNLENLLMLMVLGDMAGLPLFPTYYSLRLLPHMLPELERWKRSVLRERDFTDAVAKDL